MKLLVVVDMQNDFVTGVLGSKEAEQIVPNVVQMVQEYDGEVVYTMDTHTKDYLLTQEGKNLPVEHCVKNTSGWELIPKLAAIKKEEKVFEKPSFGSIELMQYVSELHKNKELTQIDLIGVCTDICVISNAILLKAAVPEVPVVVHKQAMAGVTKESHTNAIEAMKMCQIVISE